MQSRSRKQQVAGTFRTSLMLAAGSTVVSSVVACANASPAHSPEAPNSSKAQAQAASGKASFQPEVRGETASSGSTLESPVLRCGPAESYRFVAQEFQCPGGGNPLEGDVDRAQASRLGALDHPTNGHIVDVYRVPCKGGDVDVFVDMYGCEKFAKQLADEAPSPALQQLVGSFEKRDFHGVLEECGKPTDKLEADETMYCMVLVPASFFASGATSAAALVMHEECSRMPEPSSLSVARATLVIQVSSAVAHSAARAGEKLSDEEGARMVAVFASACDVGPDDIRNALAKVKAM